MSEENVELIHRVNDAFSQRDLDAYLDFVDPEVEFVAGTALIEGGTYQGHAGVREWWENLFSVFPDFALEVADVRILEERGPGEMRCVVTMRACAHGAGSDAPIGLTIWHVSEWRDQKVVWSRTCRSEAEALEAAELRRQRMRGTMSEDNLEIVRSMYEAFHAGDVDGALNHFHPNVFVDTGSARPDMSAGRGREYLAATVGSWAATWDGWREEIAEIRALGGEVLVVSVQRGRGKGSGIEVEVRYGILYEVAGNAIVSVRMYGTAAEALEAAGPSG